MSETFEEFKVRVDTELFAVCGLSADDMVDAPWYDLYEEIKDMRGPEFRDAVINCMAEADDLFAAMMDELGIQYD